MRGWFCVAESNEVGESPALIDDRLGLRLVAWRDASGVHVADSFCPHLGADLSMGSMVDGLLRCPFHGWRFAGDGKLTHIPYCDKLNKAANLKTYPVQERFGCLWIWADGEPTFPLDETVMEREEGWTQRHVNVVSTKANLSDTLENGIDTGHFNELHEQPSMYLKSYEMVPGNHRAHALLDYTGIDTLIDINYYGPGLATLQFKGIIDMTLHVTYTPTNSNGTHMRFSFWFKETADPKLAHFLIKEITHQFNQDVAIWDRKTYPERPLLCIADGPIMEARRWVRSFE